MFATTSRYSALDTSTITLADGRRFCPQGSSLSLLTEVVVAQNDRIDRIAFRGLGDPEQFWRVCDANDALDPGDLLVAGRSLRLPQPIQ